MKNMFKEKIKNSHEYFDLYYDNEGSNNVLLSPPSSDSRPDISINDWESPTFYGKSQLNGSSTKYIYEIS